MRLSDSSADLVRSTLPAVGAALTDITSTFYESLFTAHPELLRDLFNRGNQANGSQRQALAGAFAAFAASLVGQPDPRQATMLDRIAHKHASLGVTPDQYALVRKHLLAAVGTVLGDAATEPVTAAWDEVYQLMAAALTGRETRLYSDAGLRPGDPFADHRVAARRVETDDVVSFVVVPADGSPAAPFRPGQYVSVQVELPDGARQIRQYSLSGRADGTLRFSVKRVTGTPDGEVSVHLHDRVRAGDVLRISAPFGELTLAEGEGPVLLVSAGIGCTPMIGMLSHLADTSATRRVIALHADRSEHTHALRDDLRRHAADLANAEFHLWYEQPAGDWPAARTGRLDLGDLPIPADVDAYVCGPLPFMRSLVDQLRGRGVPAERIRYEVFGPDTLQTAS